MIASLAAGAVMLLALPAVSQAEHGSNCDYAQTPSAEPNAAPGQEIPGGTNDLDGNPANGTQEVFVYTGSEGTSGTAQTVVGVCVNADGALQGGGQRLDGGTAEVGLSEDPAAAGPNDPESTDAYAVVDGDNENSDPGDGYVGVSTWETGTKDTTCDSADTGTGSNSGGCFTLRDLPAPLPPSVSVPLVPLICGNLTGPSWDDSDRDGWQGGLLVCPGEPF